MEDIYIGVESWRAEESIRMFIDNYLKGYKGESDHYEYSPFFGENEFETDDYKEMISYVLQKRGRSFHFYFENAANKEMPKAMIFINEDGSLYLGAGVDPGYLLKYENKLKNDFRSSLFMICYNVLPPDNLADFKSMI